MYLKMKREASKLRKSDEKNSKIITEWLEKNFYSKYVEEYSRKDDIINQVKGIDCIFKLDGDSLNCDEKAAVAYINKPLHTFAFELSFINKNNEVQDGWFVNKELSTEVYLLVWIDKAKKDKLESIDDIEDIEVILIDKLSLFKYLESIGWGIKQLRLKDEQIRKSDGNTEMGNIYKNGCKFAYSKHLVEKPINILISREKLRTMNML